jgi:Na+/proline symporter
MFEVFAGGTAGQFTFWAVIAILLVSIIQINANIINMGLAGSARDEGAARFGAVSGTYGKRVMIVLWVFVGLIAAGLRSGPHRLSDPDMAWGELSRMLLGPGFLGLMLIGLLAANMASVATKTMAVSALFVRNLYRPLRGQPMAGNDVRVARLAGAGALAASVLAALAMRETMAVTKLILTINLPFGAALLMMFFWRRLTRTAVWWCVVLTGGLILMELLGARTTHHSDFSAGGWLLDYGWPVPGGHGGGEKLAAQFFFDGLFPFVVLYFVSVFTPPPSAAAVDSFFGKMKTPVGKTTDLDAAALEATRRDPHRFDSTKLFPRTDWEFTRWTREDAVGFVICCALSSAIVILFWAGLRLVA